MRAAQSCTSLTGRRRSTTLQTLTVVLSLWVFVFTGSRAALAGPPTAEELRKFQLLAFSPPVKAPDFVLRNLQGKEVRLDMYRGKPLLLYFWATW